MDRCAFLIHPHTYSYLESYLRSLKQDYKPRRKALMKKVLEWLPAHKHREVVRIESATGSAAEVVMINCSLLPEQWVSLPDEFVLGRVLDACKLGGEHGCRLFGLSAFTSIVGNQGTLVAERLGVPVTSGNSFTVHTVVTDVRRAASALGLDLRRATIAVLGATGDIGGACARIFVNEVERLVLCARTLVDLERVAAELRAVSSAEIVTEQKARTAVLGVDVVISATSAVSSVIDNQSLRPGAIVCDVGFPRHISLQLIEERPDVLAFEGGLVCPPVPVDFGFDTGFPKGTIPACLAETVLLTLEQRFESFSIGRGNITTEKVSEIAAIATKHGFGLDRFRCGEFVYNDEALARVRSAANDDTRRDGGAGARALA